MNGERVSREFHSLVSIAFSRVTAELTLKIRRVDETNPNFGNKATRSIRVRVLSLALFLSLSWRKLSDRQDAGLEEDCLIYGAFILEMLAYIRVLEFNGL